MKRIEKGALVHLCFCINGFSRNDSKLTHPQPKYTSISSSSSAFAIPGASKGPSTDDPSRAPAAVEEQSAKNDRRPLGLASVGDESDSGCCCQAKDRWQIESMTQK